MFEHVLKEYVGKQKNESLVNLYNRLVFNFSGDMATVFDIVSKVPEVHEVFIGAQTSAELFEIIDLLTQLTSTEMQRRNLVSVSVETGGF